MRARVVQLSAIGLAIAACDGGGSSTTGAPPPAPSARPPIAATVAPPVVQGAPPGPTNEANPLHVPARRVKLDPGRRVFAPPAEMLAGAKVGSTLVLYATTVSGFDGDDLLVEGRGGPAYRVHAGYVVPVPDDPRVKPGDAVITEWAGVMRHAVVTKLVKDRVAVRFTDLDAKAPESSLAKTARFVKQSDGLAAGNWAALAKDGELEHVLLVSPFTDGAAKRWLALGFGGAAELVDEADLTPIPIKPSFKVGAAVMAAWTGKMRRAVVEANDTQGLFAVRFERAGKPVNVGWGLVMAAPREADAGAP